MNNKIDPLYMTMSADHASIFLRAAKQVIGTVDRYKDFSISKNRVNRHGVELELSASHPAAVPLFHKAVVSQIRYNNTLII